MAYEYQYPMPSVTTDIVLFSKVHGIISVLMIKRKNYPFENMWAFPGGFLDINKDKTIEDCAYRELKEETNIGRKHIMLNQYKTYGDIGRDPRGRVISVVFRTTVEFPLIKNVVEPKDDAKEIDFIPIIHAFSEPLAFDHHRIIKDIMGGY